MPYDHVRPYIDWAARHGGVSCVLVSTQPASGPRDDQRDAVVGFARGTLRSPGNNLSGDLVQYFSDRVHGGAPDPFDPARVDVLGVSVTTDDASRSVTVKLTARSWGGARQTLANLRIEDGVLIGDGESVGHVTPSALYCISLATIAIPG